MEKQIIDNLRNYRYKKILGESIREISKDLNSNVIGKINSSKSCLLPINSTQTTLPMFIERLEGKIVSNDSDVTHINITHSELERELGENYLESSKEKIIDTIYRLIKNECV